VHRELGKWLQFQVLLLWPQSMYTIRKRFCSELSSITCVESVNIEIAAFADCLVSIASEMFTYVVKE
jgi:hypothetical protein